MREDLLAYLRKRMLDGFEKYSAYEAAADKDEFIDKQINDLSNIELLDYIDDFLMRSGK